jgi:hypothetical protein
MHYCYRLIVPQGHVPQRPEPNNQRWSDYSYLGIIANRLRTPTEPKPLEWIGSSKKDLKALPQQVVHVFGYAPRANWREA